MLKVKTEWESLYKPGAADQDEYGKLLESLDAVLEKHLSRRDVRQLAASCGTLAKTEKECSNFENAVLAYSVRVLVKSGDREDLVKTLSTRCPHLINMYEAIEFHLALRGKNLKDPLLVLGEAYSRCRIPEVRHDLAAAVRRGFTDLGVRGKDDADFIKKAMQWYEREKEHLVVNGQYSLNEMNYPFELYDKHPEAYEKPSFGPFTREPLFKKKTGP